MIFGVLLQGSGSGYSVNVSRAFDVSAELVVFYRICFCFCLLISSWQSAVLNKVSLQYVNDIVGVFIKQIDDWIILVGMSTSSPVGILLFGGLPSGIDFGPLFLMSNVGIIYLLLFIVVIMTAMVLSNNRYEKLALLILLIGKLLSGHVHLIMAFILPLILQKICSLFSVILTLASSSASYYVFAVVSKNPTGFLDTNMYLIANARF